MTMKVEPKYHIGLTGVSDKTGEVLTDLESRCLRMATKSLAGEAGDSLAVAVVTSTSLGQRNRDDVDTQILIKLCRMYKDNSESIVLLSDSIDQQFGHLA